MNRRRDPPAPRALATTLRIAGRAMCCSVGHHAPAACAAIHARLNHFRETSFVAYDGKPVIGASLYGLDLWGEARHDRMAHRVIDECLGAMPDTAREHIALFVLCAPDDLGGVGPRWARRAVGAACAPDQGPGFHRASRSLPYGSGGVGQALIEAAQCLRERDAPSQVLLLAVDSMLQAHTIEHYLALERIATATNADGFIPGEAAAALLLTPRADEHDALWIDACAGHEDAWRIDGDAPLRADGLTTALRELADTARTELATLDFHASGMNGESWYAKETNLGLARALERRVEEFPHLMIARSVGETGSAAPLLTLAWLADLARREPAAIANGALLHFSHALGRRSALIVRPRPAPAR